MGRTALFLFPCITSSAAVNNNIKSTGNILSSIMKGWYYDMERKSKKMSVNTTIYILIGAMLVCILLVTALTAALRRGKGNPVKTGTDSGISVTDFAGGRSNNEENIVKPRTEASESKETAKASIPGNSEKTQDDTPVSVGIRYYVLPVEGSVSKAFEIDVPVYSMTMNDYRAHTGVDFTAPIGSEVLCVENGTVCKVWNDPMMGKCISVDHGDSIVSTYMNLSEQLASELEIGTRVSKGQQLGTVGETSLIEIAEEPHLHLEMKVGGEYVDPIEYMGVEGIYAEYEG